MGSGPAVARKFGVARMRSLNRSKRRQRKLRFISAKPAVFVFAVAFVGKRNAIALQETTSTARWEMRVSSVANFIRCFCANSARYKSVNCLLDCAVIFCGEKSSGINRQRCFRTNSERAARQGCGSALKGKVSPLLMRKKPSSLIGQVAVCLPRNHASTLGWSSWSCQIAAITMLTSSR